MLVHSSGYDSWQNRCKPIASSCFQSTSMLLGSIQKPLLIVGLSINFCSLPQNSGGVLSTVADPLWNKNGYSDFHEKLIKLFLNQPLISKNLCQKMNRSALSVCLPTVVSCRRYWSNNHSANPEQFHMLSSSTQISIRLCSTAVFEDEVVWMERE